MRVVVVGAYGLLGGYVSARLVEDGHEVVGVGRDTAAASRRFPALRWLRGDLRKLKTANWAAMIAGADAVVNCAGALQDSRRDDLAAVHETAIGELAQACVQQGVRRFVQISAAGVERAQGRFGQTKKAADDALKTTSLDWVILRPGLVLAPAAYGGSALLRGLAAFPGVIPAVHPDAIVQVVSVNDVAEAVARSVRLDAPARLTCDLVSAESSRLRHVLLALRGWLGLPPAKVIAIPDIVAQLGACVADGLAHLGWRSPMRSAALAQLASGVTGRSEDAPEHLGFTPRSLERTLAAWPSGVQERWFAKLYVFKPLAIATLVGFWIASGAIGLVQLRSATSLLLEAGLDPRLAFAFVVGGSLLDLALGVLAAFRRTAPLAFVGMLLVTGAYLAAATGVTPHLWADPLGPLVKSIPAAMLALAALAMMDER